jgi:hypothetical protein
MSKNEELELLDYRNQTQRLWVALRDARAVEATAKQELKEAKMARELAEADLTMHLAQAEQEGKQTTLFTFSKEDSNLVDAVLIEDKTCPSREGGS